MFSNIYEGDKTYEDGKQYVDDDRLLVRFETKAVHNEWKSTQEGRPIFDEVEFISIIVPGSRDVFTTELNDTYKRRFSKRYAKWREDTSNTKIEGTPLAELTWMGKTQIAELNYSNVFTVEQLANMSDQTAMKFMGSYQLRDRAKRFLEAAAGEAPMLKMQAELSDRDAQIQVLQQKVADLTAAFEKMQTKKG